MSIRATPGLIAWEDLGLNQADNYAVWQSIMREPHITDTAKSSSD